MKEAYTELINEQVKDSEKLEVFKKEEIVEPVRETKEQGIKNDFVGIISRATKTLNRFF